MKDHLFAISYRTSRGKVYWGNGSWWADERRAQLFPSKAALNDAMNRNPALKRGTEVETLEPTPENIHRMKLGQNVVYI